MDGRLLSSQRHKRPQTFPLAGGPATETAWIFVVLRGLENLETPLAARDFGKLPDQGASVHFGFYPFPTDELDVRLQLQRRPKTATHCALRIWQPPS